MSIYIVYPERRWVPNAKIKSWFTDAVANSEIDPSYLKAKTVKEMANALDDAGIITQGDPRLYYGD